MIYETRTSSLVKTVIYRVWVLITGQSIESAVVPTVIINLVWIMSFYFYHRVWARITWGRLQLFHLYRLLLRFFCHSIGLLGTLLRSPAPQLKYCGKKTAGQIFSLTTPIWQL